MLASISGCAYPTRSVSNDARQAAASSQSIKRSFASIAAADGPNARPTPHADPVGYLGVVCDATRALQGYRCVFTRQERLGLFPNLRPTETMRALYRASPLSVRFDWIEPESELITATYVAGFHDNQVGLLWRSGWFGSGPNMQWLDPMLSVAFGKSRYPITEFGIQRMIERTISLIGDAQSIGGATVRCLGRKTFEGAPVHHLEIAYPRGAPFDGRRQHLYIHTESDLPVGVELYLNDGTLDTRYTYQQIEPLLPSPGDEAFVVGTE